VRTRLIVAVATLIATVVAGAVTLTSDRAAGSAVIEQVGHNDLGARGVNASVAVADHCAYVGSRGGGAIAVLDVADPANPRVAAELAAHPRTSARELRIVQSSHVLVVLNMSLETGGGVNTLDFYRWANDCVHPLAVGTYSFGGRLPHEFYLWQDPAQPQRVLLFVAMFFSGGGNGHADLEVVDASDPAAPRFLGRWDGPAALGFGATLTWSTPVIHDGLIFVVDQNQGMFILRYSGPHQDEVQQLGFAEGNSNQTAALGANPVATPPALTTPAPSSIAVTPAAPLVATAATGGDTRWWRAPWFVVVIVAALVAALGAPLLLRWRRRRSARRT
jgi:hypothetical protein